MRAISRTFLAMLILFVAVATFACSPEQIAAVARVVRIVLSPSAATIAVGGHFTIQALPTDSAGRPVPNAEIAWSSSRLTVATVAPTGEVTGVTPGTSTITAESGDQAAALVVTVTTVPVATVGVAPATASVRAGQTTQLAATPRDASGASLTGRVVTWSSSNGQVATVSSSGLVTGVAVGTAVATATSEGVSGQATITVTASSSGATWPNEPAGFRMVTDQPWDALASLGWQHINRTSQSRVVVDATAPLSPANVLEDLYPAGFPGGSDPAVDWVTFGSTQEIYVGFWFKHSPNFESHPVGNKIAFIWSFGSVARDFIIGVNPPNQGWPLVLVSEGFGVPGDEGAHGFFPNMSSGQALPGTWHRAEVYVRNSSPLGTVNGVVRWWLDGQLVGSYTNVIMPAGTAWNQFELTPTWGGTGSVKTQSDYIRYDHAWVSRP